MDLFDGVQFCSVQSSFVGSVLEKLIVLDLRGHQVVGHEEVVEAVLLARTRRSVGVWQGKDLKW